MTDFNIHPRRAVTTDSAPRPTNARTTAPSDSTRRRWARMATVEAAAREAAHADGLREGYRTGWRLGLVAGVLIGALLVGAAWSAASLLRGTDTPAATGAAR